MVCNFLFVTTNKNVDNTINDAAQKKYNIIIEKSVMILCTTSTALI